MNDSSVAGPMMLGGLAVGGYSITFVLVEPYLGIASSVPVAYVTAVLLISLPTMLILRKCEKKEEQKTNQTNLLQEVQEEPTYELSSTTTESTES